MKGKGAGYKAIEAQEERTGKEMGGKAGKAEDRAEAKTVAKATGKTVGMSGRSVEDKAAKSGTPARGLQSAPSSGGVSFGKGGTVDTSSVPGWGSKTGP